MPDPVQSNPRNREQWTAQPVIGWLLEEGRLLPDIEAVVQQLGQKMLESGAPLWRLRLSMRTLHPLITAFSAVWESDAGTSELIETPHGLEGRTDYLGSPLEIIARTQSAYRKHLTDTLSESDHDVLHELKTKGATDYYGVPMRYSRGTGGILVFNTKLAKGFSDHDIDHFNRIASTLAPIAEVFSMRQISRAIADAYLGPRTGRLVLDGQITRGHIQTISAAILVSDIRDWTGLSARMDAEQALALANAYFEVISRAVETNDGEILKFIGDGVLAVFPVNEGEVSPESACANALAAAKQSLQHARIVSELQAVKFGLGLHFGEVLYGNIGSATRLDFTVLGQAVNFAARIEGLCQPLDRPLLFSESFADRIGDSKRIIANTNLKGHSGNFSIFSIAD